MTGQREPVYEALSPKAEVEPITLRGISPRLDTLEGKTIGVAANFKPGADFIIDVVEELLKERFPAAKILRYKERFRGDPPPELLEWAKKTDAAVLARGD